MWRSPLPRALWLALWLGLLAAPAVEAQIEERPGYFPFDELGLLSAEDLSLEINLSGALLAMVADAFDQEDPEFARLVRDLDGIRVRMAESENLDRERLQAGFDRAHDWLRSHRWEPLLRLREEDEEIYVYARTEGGEMVGVTLLVLEPETEVVLVNIVGRLDLALLGALASSLDIPQLDVIGRDDVEPDEGDQR